ncbi:hypothetical protein QYF36_022361 [Acer negundo]|nr:hypothetical protein QYF36_022361 [Acer negundo]
MHEILYKHVHGLISLVRNWEFSALRSYAQAHTLYSGLASLVLNRGVGPSKSSTRHFANFLSKIGREIKARKVDESSSCKNQKQLEKGKDKVTQPPKCILNIDF